MTSTSFEPETLDEINNSFNIVDLIGNSPKVMNFRQTSGGQYVGHTNLDSKSKASLKVNSLTGEWHDLAAGIGGRALHWIGYEAGYTNFTGRDFVEVVQLAADRAGVELKGLSEEEKGSIQEWKELKRLWAEAAQTYHNNLKNKPELYDFIKTKWGLNKETVDKYKIGYANEYKNLHKLNQTTLGKSGILKADERGKEIFHDRITFPYWKRDEVVYFAARATRDDVIPKYMKLMVCKEKQEYVSPLVQNSFFYGEDSVTGQKECVITEGVTDCLSMLQTGFPCISPVTKEFREKDGPKLIQLCKRLDTVYICNDNDENNAGRDGALKTAALLEKEGISVRIVILPRPEGVNKVDIAEYMKTHTSDDFKKLQAESLGLWEFKLSLVKVPVKTLDRIRAFEAFISNDLHAMNQVEWKVFVKKEVIEKYGFKVSDVRQIIAETINKRNSESIDKNGDNKGPSLPIFDLDSTSGRGVVYKILTDDFLKLYKPVITFADSEELRIYQDGVYSNFEGSAEMKINNYITEDLALQKYGACLSPGHTENVIKKIKNKTHVLRSEVDNDPFKIAVKNGVIDVKTRELSKPTPACYYISKIDIEYNPDIKPVPEFDEYLKTTFKGVEWQIPVMQELVGYCLYRAYPYEFLVFFTGDGRNGKGLFFQLLGHLVGKHNLSSIPLDEIVRKQSEFTLCDLYGKMVNLCGEIGKTRISETRDIKMLTGKDDCRGRFPYQRGFVFRNYAKMFFSMNEPPVIEDFTVGMKNRIKIYDFPNEFLTGKNAIDDLEEKLTTPEALTGLLNWALDGLNRLLNNHGKLSDIRTAAQMGIVYEKKSRPMYYFVRDCIAEKPLNVVLREELEQAYTDYAKENNLPSLSKEKIREKLIHECRDVGIKVELTQKYKTQLIKEYQDRVDIPLRPRVYTGIEILKPQTKQNTL